MSPNSRGSDDGGRRTHSTTHALSLTISLALFATSALAYEGYNVAVSQPPFTLHGAEANDELATWMNDADSVRAGDLNGDGIPDLVVGVSHLDGPGNTRVNGGELGVYFGPLLNGQVWDLATRPADLTIYGRETPVRFGAAVRIADLNADGIQDLIVGSPNSSRPDLTQTERGEACIVFGPLAAGVIDLAADEPGFCVVGARRYDGIGESLAVGDVSGDGVLDLIVGGEQGAHGTSQYLGGIYVVFGPFAPGPIRDLRLTPPDVTIMGRSDSCFLGSVVEVGDMSGDGQDDIAAGMVDASAGAGRAGAGAVAVLFGPLSRGTIDLRTTPPDVLILGADAQDNLGALVAVADLNGDGAAELVAAAPQADGAGNLSPEGGEVHVLLGPLVSGTTVDNVTTTSDITFTLAASSRLGLGLAAGSVGAGGGILMGAPNTLQDFCFGHGHAFLVNELPPRGSVLDPASLASTLAIGCGNTGDVCGTSCFVADLSGDGLPESMIGASSYGPAHDRFGAGALYVLGTDDRCEEVPAGMADDALRVRRSGDDVLLDYDATGLGPEMLGVDVFRGTIFSLERSRLYDHAVIAGGCGAMTSPFVDAGGAAPGVETHYYLLTRGCPAACDSVRFEGGLGADSFGVARPMAFQPDPFTCQ